MSYTGLEVEQTGPLNECQPLTAQELRAVIVHNARLTRQTDVQSLGNLLDDQRHRVGCHGGVQRPVVMKLLCYGPAPPASWIVLLS